MSKDNLKQVVSNRCEVIDGKNGKCDKKAIYKVRHKEHDKSKSFYVCKGHIDAYKFEIFPNCRNFIVKKLKGSRNYEKL